MDRDALNPNAVLQRKIQTNLSESASRVFIQPRATANGIALGQPVSRLALQQLERNTPGRVAERRAGLL